MAGPAEGVENGADDASHARADREALDWLIRLQDQPDDSALRARFDAWLRASNDNALAWAEAGRVSRLIRAATIEQRDHGETDSRNIVSLDAARARRLALPILRHRLVALSAVAAAACLVIALAPDMLLRLRADAVAATGEVKTVQLTDGSVVTLAPGSALAIDYDAGQRRITLLRGDAYFDVARDPDRPFRIATAGTTTTVLGTAFEVRRIDAGVAVAVRRGLVRAACDDAPTSATLSAGQGVDLACDAGAQRKAVEPARVATWMQGQLVANDRPMREIIDALRPWYGGLIIARGPGIDRRRVTGVYDLRDPGRALAALAAAHGARVRRITPWVMTISAD